MALKKNIDTVYGIEIKNAYCRIDNVIINNKTNITFLLKSYADKTAKEFNTQTFQCSYILDNTNPIAQAYAHLKTLQEFADATDC